MSRSAVVVSFEEATTEFDAHAGVATCDLGGEQLVTAPYYPPPGYYGHPLPGDTATLIEGEGKGNWIAVAFADPKLPPPETAAGEITLYSRSAPGVIAGKITFKADGSIVLNGSVTISPSGAITADGNVVAGTISLQGHVHPGDSLTTTATVGLAGPATIAGNTGTPS